MVTELETVPPPARCDVAVVGAGILGLAVARELQRRDPRLHVAVLEREARVGAHQTGHNSGVIHSGVYYAPGSLKARMCVAGAAAMYDFCEERGIAYRRSGKLIVATSPRERPRLDELERRGHANGVPGLRRLDGPQIAELEPAFTGVAALHCPSTGVVDFSAVALALAADALERGATLSLGCEITAADGDRSGVTLRHRHGVVQARRAVLCAGAWSDRLAVAAGAPADPRIVPFRGAYFDLGPEQAARVRALVYPVPDPALPFLGIHFTRTVDDHVHVGPTALMVGARDAYRLTRLVARDLRDTLRWPGTWRMIARFWRTGMTELSHAVSRQAVARAASAYLPGITADDLTRGGAGVRAQALARDGALVDDFVVSRTESALHLRNAPSPAATSSLALADLIVDRCARELDL